MGIFSKSLGIQALSLEDPSQPLLPPSALFESLGLGRSDAGVMVNEMQAMRITTAQSCVRIISEDLGSNNHEIFQRMPDGSMNLAHKHRYWSLIHDRPNPNMSAKVFWGALVASAVGWGNGYAWIKRDGGGRIISLIPLRSGLTSPVKLRGELFYATTQTDTGAVAYLDPINVLHVIGLSFDGIVGLSPIRTCMNAFGLALAAEKFGAQFFGNGARTTGIFTYPGVLEPEAEENLQKSLREKMTGEQGLRPIILEEGLKWQQTTIPPNEAQFIDTRRFQRSEIACIYRVAMHLLQDLQRSTNNNIEHQSLDHVRYCLRPWAIAVEQEVNCKILGNGPFVMEHNFNDMMRGDFASQTAGIQILRGNGVWSANDALKFMRMNQISKEEGGDVRYVQGANVPLESLLLAEGQPAKPEDSTTDSNSGASQPFNQLAPQYHALFKSAVIRTIDCGGGRNFARQLFRGPLTAIATSMVGQRFGIFGLTNNELDLVDRQAAALADSAESWSRAEAPALSAQFASQAYEVLSREILQ